MKPFLSSAFCFFLTAFLPTPLQADLIIEVRNSTLLAGGTGFVDVYIYEGTGVNTLGRFGYEFTIAGATPGSGDLQFASIQSDSETATLLPKPYIFFDDSGGFNSSRDSATIIRGGDQLAVADSIVLDRSFLLARLELIHVGALSVPTHNFVIALNPSSPFTEFDRDFDPGTTDPGFENYGTFSSFSGIVTVNAVAVPEPSSLLLVAATGGLA